MPYIWGVTYLNFAVMKIDVLGLGESLKFYKPDGDVSIGVNDIWTRHQPDYVLCADVPSAFSAKKASETRMANCKGFYSQCLEWSDIPNFRLLEFAGSRGSLQELDSEKFCYSNNSTYIACVLAYKLGAKKIVMHGVDFVDHPVFNGTSRDKAVSDFKQLNDALRARGVELYVGNKYSFLSNFLPVFSSAE